MTGSHPRHTVGLAGFHAAGIAGNPQSFEGLKIHLMFGTSILTSSYFYVNSNIQ